MTGHVDASDAGFVL